LAKGIQYHHHGAAYETPHSPVVERFAQLAVKSQGRLAQLQGFTEESVKKQAAVSRLINHYRSGVINCQQ